MSWLFCQYYRDKLHAAAVNSESCKSKINITEKTPADGNTTDVKIAVPLKYLSKPWRTPELPLINRDINPILAWSADCVICSATGATKFGITDITLVVTKVIQPDCIFIDLR